MLANEVKIAGETVRKLGSRVSFTGDELFTSDLKNQFSKSIEQKFEDTAQVDGLTAWNSNAEVPFSDMLLDFVQIGAITFEQAEFSLLQKAKDDEASLATLFRAKDGNIYLGEGALDYRAERLAKLEAV